MGDVASVIHTPVDNFKSPCPSRETIRGPLMNQNFDSIQRIVDAHHPPIPWQGDTQIPWHDPQFSERMLKVHLDQDTHQASRSKDVIEQHVGWLHQQLAAQCPANRPWRVLDVGCGPGLYAHALARRQIHCTGFDFSPAPLNWAKDTAKSENLDCTFLQADLTQLPKDLADTHGLFDAVTFWFGEFHSFRPEVVAEFLPKLAGCLHPNGLFVLEYQPWDIFVKEQDSHWQVCQESVFCSEPHLWLEEFGWDEATKTETHVHWIISSKSGTLSRYVQCHQAYDDQVLPELLNQAGLVDPIFYPPLTDTAEDYEFPVMVTRRAPSI